MLKGIEGSYYGVKRLRQGVKRRKIEKVREAELICRTLNNDQQRLQSLLDRGYDVIIRWPPSAGKSLPLACWWLEKFKIGKQIRSKIRGEVTLDKIKNVVRKIRIPKIIWAVPLKRLVDQVAYDLEMLILKSIGDIKVDNIVNYEPQLVATRGSNQNRGSFSESLAIVGIYESLVSEMDLSNVALVVLDEFQELAEAANRPSLIIAITNMFLKLSKNTHTRFAVLTGSTHEEDIQRLVEVLSVLSPKRHIVSDIMWKTNRSVIKVIPLNMDIQTLYQIIQEMYAGTCIIAFSKKMIDALVDWAIKNIKPDQMILERRITINNEKIPVADIYNKIPERLAECLVRRIMYIYRDTSEKYNKAIPLLIQCYNQRVINVCIATDAIGKGMNLNIRKLFLTSLKDNMSDSDLIQLVHRAGRGASTFAEVYCQPEDFQRVVKAVYGHTDSVVDPGYLSPPHIVELLKLVISRMIKG